MEGGFLAGLKGLSSLPLPGIELTFILFLCLSREAGTPDTTASTLFLERKVSVEQAEGQENPPS